MAPKKKVAEAPKKAEFASKEEVKNLSASVDSILESMEMMMQMMKAQASVSAVAPVKETPLDVEVRKAGPNANIVNPDWDDKAKEILGEFLDHCEIEYLKKGGTVFTVVIKTEKSNAPAEYLKMYGSDRRSKEIGSEGEEGVEAWCKLVAQNLKRPKY